MKTFPGDLFLSRRFSPISAINLTFFSIRETASNVIARNKNGTGKMGVRIKGEERERGFESGRTVREKEKAPILKEIYRFVLFLGSFFSIYTMR